MRNEVERTLGAVEMNARAVVAPRIKHLARKVETFEADYGRYREKLAALAPAIELAAKLAEKAVQPEILRQSSSSFLEGFEGSLSELRRTLDAVVQHHGALESFSDELCAAADRGGTEASVDLAAAAAAGDTHVEQRQIALEELRTALANATAKRVKAEEFLGAIRTVEVLTRTASEAETAWREIKADREELASRREALVRDRADTEERRGPLVERLNTVVDLIVRHPDYFEDFEHTRLQERIQTYREQLGPVPDVPDAPRRGGGYPVIAGDEERLHVEKWIERRIRILTGIGDLDPSSLRELETVSFRLAGGIEETDRLLSSTTLSDEDLAASERRLGECLTRLERTARVDPEPDPAATPGADPSAPLAGAGDPEAPPEAGEEPGRPEPGGTEPDPGPPPDGDPDAEETGEPDFGQAPPDTEAPPDAEEAPSAESEPPESPEDIPLPDVIGLKIDVAARRVADAGLVPQPQLGSPATSEAQENTVEAAIPANIPLRKNDPVILKVWRAPVRTGVVPDVEGLYVDEAYTAVEAAGLSPVIVVGEDTRQVDEVNRVYRQAPPAGSTVEEGATVKLTAYVADAPGRVVPKLTGMDVPTARALLDDRELVLEPEVVEPAGSLQTENTIARQYPEPGVEVPRGTGIRAYVYDEFEPPAPVTRAPAGEDFGEASPRPIDVPPPAARREEPAAAREVPRSATGRLSFLDVPTRFLFAELEEDGYLGYPTRRIDASTLRIERPAGGWILSEIDQLFYQGGPGQYLRIFVYWRPVGGEPQDRFAYIGETEHVGRPGEIGVMVGSTVGPGAPHLMIQVTDPDDFVKLVISTPAEIQRLIDLEDLKAELRTFAREIFDQFDGIAAPR